MRLPLTTTPEEDEERKPHYRVSIRTSLGTTPKSPSNLLEVYHLIQKSSLARELKQAQAPSLE
jgi:hypothetical protein